MLLELLEGRTLLTTLNIVGGVLSYSDITIQTNQLVIKTSGSPKNYTFTDDVTITLGAGAVSAGWTGSGTTSVSGPDSSVTAITTNLLSRNDSVTIQDADAPVTLNFTNATGNVDKVTIGSDSSKGAQGVNAAVTIGNSKGSTALIMDDTSNTTKPLSVSMSSTKITGLLGTNSQGLLNGIDVSKANLSSELYREGVSGTTLSITTTAKAPVTTEVDTGPNASSVNITTVQAVTGPLTIKAQGTHTITLGTAPQGVQSIESPVTLETAGAGTIAALNVDDSADTTAQTAMISSTMITGLAPVTFSYSGAKLVALNVKGGEGGNSFTVASLPDAIVTLNTGASAALNPNSPNPNTVNVENTADPANANMLDISAGGLDTINLSPSVAINVTGTTKILNAAVSTLINAPGPDDVVTLTNSSASTGSINGTVQLAGAPESTKLVIDDSADTTAVRST